MGTDSGEKSLRSDEMTPNEVDGEIERIIGFNPYGRDVTQIALKLVKKYRELEIEFLGVLNQACGEKDERYDSLCISSYESALEFAVETGLIKQEKVIR